MNKFILAENIKHILSEKYLLDERFILTEASAGLTADLENSLNTLTKKINSGDFTKIDNWAKTNTVKTDPNQNWNANLENTIKNVEAHYNSKQLPELKASVKNYLQILLLAIDPTDKSETHSNAINKIAAYPTLNQTYTQLRKIVTDQDTAADNTANNDTEIQTLKKLFDTFRNAVESTKILATDRLSQLIDNAINAVENIRKWVETITDLLTKTNNIKDNSSLTDATVQQLITAINNIINNCPDNLINTTSKPNTINNFNNVATKIKTTEWQTALTKANEEITKADVEAEDQKDLDNMANSMSKNAIDWAIAFKKAAEAGNTKKLSELWDKYYRDYWGVHADKAKALGSTLSNLLLDPNYGFEPKRNAWLVFVQYCFDNGYNLNRDNFYAIQQSSKYLSRGALTRKDTLSLNKVNILYCKDLYFRDTSAISNLLYFQSKARALYDTDLRTSTKFVKQTLADRYSGDETKAKLFFTSLFDKNYNALNRPAPAPADFTTLKLKDWRDVRQEYQNCFGIEEEKPEEDNRKEISNTDIAALIKGLSQPDFSKLLYYLYIKYQSFTNADLYGIIQPYLLSIPALAPSDVRTLDKKLAKLKISNIEQTLRALIKQAQTEKII